MFDSYTKLNRLNTNTLKVLVFFLFASALFLAGTNIVWAGTNGADGAGCSGGLVVRLGFRLGAVMAMQNNVISDRRDN